MGPWDGARPEPILGKEPRRPRAEAGALALSTWKQLLDQGSMQDGDAHLAATRPPGASPGQPGDPRRRSRTCGDATVVLTGDRGSVTLPVEVADDMVDGVVWLPGQQRSVAACSPTWPRPAARSRVKGAGK